MTNRNRQFTRTPRKDKLWLHAKGAQAFGTGSQVLSPTDLLSAGLSDIGVNLAQRLTCMRIVGKLRVVEISDATTPAYAGVTVGIAWVPTAIVSAGAADAQIPDPDENLNEAQWLQVWTMGALEPATAILGQPAQPVEDSIQVVDVRQMRKQPTADYKLAFITRVLDTVESNTMSIQFDLRIMLALP